MPITPSVAPTTPAATPVDMSQFETTTPGINTFPNIPSSGSGGGDAGAQAAGFSDYADYQNQQAAASRASAVPSFDLIGATNAVYNTPAIQAANKAISDRQQASADAQANINDNPFYSDAERTGQLSKETTQADNDITVQQNILANLNSQAAIQLNAAQGQYNIDDTAYQQKLTNFQNLVSSGALDNASASDLAGMAVSTGIPISMIQSMQSVSKAKDTPAGQSPQLIQSTDNQGNLTLLAVDSNGTVLNQTTIAGAGKAATYKGQPVGDTPGGNSTGGNSTGGNSAPVSATKQAAADKAAAPSSLTEDVKNNKMTLGTAMGLYQQYGMTKQKIYDIYVSNTPYKQSDATKANDQATYGVK